MTAELKYSGSGYTRYVYQGEDLLQRGGLYKSGTAELTSSLDIAGDEVF